MRRAGIVVDVQAIRLVVYDIGVCAQGIENTLSDVPAGAIGTVQTDLDTLEGVDTQRNQVAHVAVTTGDVIHSTANMLTVGKVQLRPVLIKDMEFAVDVVFHQQQSLLRHLLAVAVDQLDAIIVVGVVARGNHNTTVKVIHASDVRHGRSGGDVQQISICSRSRQTCNQTVLEHIGAATGVLANDDTSRIVVSIAHTQSIIIPAEEATHFISMVCC